MAATRADVARLAGVSPAVVSFVLLGTRPVASKTRERVLSAVDELKYRPNAVAKALRTNSTLSVGLLVQDFRNPFILEMTRALENVAFESDRAVIIGATHYGDGREARYVRSFLDRQVDGLIMLAKPASAVIAQARLEGIPSVLVDRGVPGESVSTVISDEKGGSLMGVDHLIRSGRLRVACIAGPARSASANQRVAGWRAGLKKNDIAASGALLVRASLDENGGRAAARELLSRGDGFDAVFVSSDAQAFGVLSEIYAAGVRIPDDIAVVSFDGTAASAFTSPPLTVVAQPFGKLAQAVMDQLDTEMRDPDAPIAHHVLETELIVRQSAP